MKIAYITDSLGAGGAERQLTELAIGMKLRGHEVEVVCYYPGRHYECYLNENSIHIIRLNANNRFQKVIGVRNLMNSSNYDIVHCTHLSTAVLGVLSRFRRKTPKIIANDWSAATYSKRSIYIRLSFIILDWADWVVTETDSNRKSILGIAPYLRNRLSVIRNGVDLKRFDSTNRCNSTVFEFITVASVIPIKNPFNVIEAINILKTQWGSTFNLSWYGNYIDSQTMEENLTYKRVMESLKKYNLDDQISFKGAVKEIEIAYCKADALLHVSFMEGIPNALCEAMVSGLPVVVSSVSDLTSIVNKAQNGFLCDPNSPESISEAMIKMMELSKEKRSEMGFRSRQQAIALFSKNRFLDEYENLYKSLLKK